MNKLNEIEKEFIRIYESIIEMRGLPSIIGRVMAIFFLEGRELGYKEIANLSGYSISSVGRALDQMVELGILQKSKNLETKLFVYAINIDFNQLMISVIEKMMKTYKSTNSDVRNLSEATKSLENPTDKERIQRLEDILNNLEKTMLATIRYTERLIKELSEE